MLPLTLWKSWVLEGLWGVVLSDGRPCLHPPLCLPLCPTPSSSSVISIHSYRTVSTTSRSPPQRFELFLMLRCYLSVVFPPTLPFSVSFKYPLSCPPAHQPEDGPRVYSQWSGNKNGSSSRSIRECWKVLLRCLCHPTVLQQKVQFSIYMGSALAVVRWSPCPRI